MASPPKLRQGYRRLDYMYSHLRDTTLVVETEAWGVHRSVYEGEVEPKSCKHVLTIKGVADNGDQHKDDQLQYRATRNAFETLRALLKTVSASDLA
jgi:hypothetical protein